MSDAFSAKTAPQVNLADVVRTLIFPKLALVYGQRLTLMYEGLQNDAVMADWASGLDGIGLEGIAWALKNLPPTDFPPNVQQFRRLCGERPGTTQRQQILPTQVRSVVPAFVEVVSRRIHESRSNQEPRQVRTARAFIARVTGPGHLITQHERHWADHYAQIVQRYEQRSTDATDATETARRKATAKALAGAHATPARHEP